MIRSRASLGNLGMKLESLSKKIEQIDVSAWRLANSAPFADIEISGGLLGQEAMQLFDKKKP